MLENDDRVKFAVKMSREIRDKYRIRCQIAKVTMEDQTAKLVEEWSDEQIKHEREEILRSTQIEEF